MKTEMLNYNLPGELIAQQPTTVRSNSRLLVLNRSTGRILDRKFSDIVDFLSPGDCLVLNDTKVLPARFFAQRTTGAALEGLFLAEDNENTWKILLKGARKVNLNETFLLINQNQQIRFEAQLINKTDNGQCLIKLNCDQNAREILEQIGLPPLPPYIKRDNNREIAEKDRQRYQTVYAKNAGAVAAPTAGLHFTDTLIEQLKNNGVRFASVTLHVGAGTFKPITTDNLEDHQIHEEWFSIDDENIRILQDTKSSDGRIIPVGTTSTRVLETIARNRPIQAASGQTDLFITPGFKFNLTDALITNFHLPKSSLLALVAAFAGLDNIMAAYKHAIEHKYRFYSYGDAMLIA